MRPLPLILVATIAMAFGVFGGSADTLAAPPNEDTRFFGLVNLFGEPAPAGTHVRTRVDGEVCANDGVETTQLEGESESKPAYDLEWGASCGVENSTVAFELFRDDSSIATACTPTASLLPGEQRLDISCGVDGEFGAVWIITNNTSEMQRAAEIFPRVALGGVNAEGPAACGLSGVAHVQAPFLLDHAEVVFPEPCIAPGESVRLGLSTDCPCHSELEIERVVWLPNEPLFKANVDCDSDVDAADALRDLLMAAEAQIQSIDGCPKGNNDHLYPSALGGLWGDINCDSQITVLDAINILRTAQQLPSGIDASCRATYGVYS